MLAIIFILQNIKYTQHVRNWLYLHLQTLRCHTDGYCYWFHMFDVRGKNPDQAWNPLHTKFLYVDHSVVCSEFCIHSCTVTDMKNIKYYCSYGCDTHLSTDQTFITLCMLCMFFTQKMMCNICGVMNKLLSNVLAESLVCGIFTMTCDF